MEAGGSACRVGNARIRTVGLPELDTWTVVSTKTQNDHLT